MGLFDELSKRRDPSLFNVVMHTPPAPRKEKPKCEKIVVCEREIFLFCSDSEERDGLFGTLGTLFLNQPVALENNFTHIRVTPTQKAVLMDGIVRAIQSIWNREIERKEEKL